VSHQRSRRPGRAAGPAIVSLCVSLCLLVASCATPAKSAAPNDILTTRPAPEPVKLLAATKPTSMPARAMTLFDGRTLKGWHVLNEDFFTDHGKVYASDGTIVLEAGSPATGIRWAGPFPTVDYEVTLDAMRVDGSDFFCGMTFPVGDSPCTWIVGGWGGCVVGLSNIDGAHAAENETTTGVSFKNGRWYHLRLRVTATDIEAWIDGEQVINLTTRGRKLTIWLEQEPVRPFGVATWYTKAALRNVRLAPAESP
jgi:hypothetical protein